MNSSLLKETAISVVGAGLAGSECAYQLAERGFRVNLYEMRPTVTTPAHKTAKPAELVCSNSFGSQADHSAAGQLKREALNWNSFILKTALKHSVPAGMALAVDRERFSDEVSRTLYEHPRIEVIAKAIESLDEVSRPAVIATGPLTHGPLAKDLAQHFDEDTLYFFDAIAPIIDADSIDLSKVWRADRYDRGTEDYLNCPLTKDQYYHLIDEIKSARKTEPKEFEKTPYFDGCMPIEAIIERGDETLRFGPLSAKGLNNMELPQKPYAVLQLRQENKEGTAYNMVGFQTKMAYSEQVRIFRKIPGLEQADFLKLGSIHRNLYFNSPKVLQKDLSSKKDPWLFFAGQITGVEGYFESSCTAIIVAHFLSQKINDQEMPALPRESAMGSLLNAILEVKEKFQPTNMNFSLLPAIEGKEFRGHKGKIKRRDTQLSRAQKAFTSWLEETGQALSTPVPSPLAATQLSQKAADVQTTSTASVSH